MYIYDGQIYKSQDDYPDLGSWVCTSSNGNKRCYQGLSTDLENLPKYDNLKTGSRAIAIDTSELYLYYAPTKTWYVQPDYDGLIDAENIPF